MVLREPRGMICRPPQANVLAALQSTPWAVNLLSDPAILTFDTPNRMRKSSTEDTIMAETLATDQTIPVWQGMYKPYGPGSVSSYGEYLVILVLGSGLNGHASTLHGGMISLIADEIMGHASFYHRDPSNATFTATMTVDFKKPIPTPGLLLGRAWLEERSEGRKHWLKGVLEDGEGGVYAHCRCLYLEVPRPAPKL